MHRYGLKKSALEVNNVTVFTRGVFDVSRVLKSPVYLSLPGFLYGDPSLYRDVGLSTPDEGRYESFVSVSVICDNRYWHKLIFGRHGTGNWTLAYCPEAHGLYVCKKRRLTNLWHSTVSLATSTFAFYCINHVNWFIIYSVVYISALATRRWCHCILVSGTRFLFFVKRGWGLRVQLWRM